MRVLVTSTAGMGHVHPMVPVARALADRGHDVLWATPADGGVHVEPAGVPWVAAGPAGLAGPLQLRERFPEISELPPEDVPDVAFGKLFGAIAAPAILAELAPIALDWRPDLVVADAAEFAGHIVAAELDVPSVTKGFGPVLPRRRVAAAEPELAPLWRSRGLEPRPFGGAYDHLYLDIYPPGLATETGEHIARRQPMRPISDDGRVDPIATVPLPEARPDAPLVYLTMGTVFSDPGPIKAVLSGLDDLDVRVMVTVGPRVDPSALGPQPAHVHVEQYVPQAALLPHCSVVVSHGGSGTMLASLRHGLPQLCLPQGADQFLNAAALSAAGAGISLNPGAATPTAIKDAVRRLLGGRSYRESAAKLRQGIEAMPSPSDVVPLLEELASSGRRRFRQGVERGPARRS